MSSFVQFSDAAILGIHAMIELGTVTPESVNNKTLAQKLKASGAHLAKVMQRLRQVNLVIANRGPSGGYRLARDVSSITLLEVFEAIEGPAQPRYCMFGTPVCENPDCGLGTIIGQIDQLFIDFMGQTTLNALPKAREGLKVFLEKCA